MTLLWIAGGRMLMRIGDKEVEYNPNFRFYLTTKLSNPHYSPETSAKTTIVNFAVKEQVSEVLVGTGRMGHQEGALEVGGGQA